MINIDKKGRLAVLKRLIARELSHLLALQSAGFLVAEVQISWSAETSSWEVRRPFQGLFEFARTLETKTYVEKRIFVLCAGAVGELSVWSRELVHSQKTPTGDEFWQCLQDDKFGVYLGKAAVSDYRKLCELATVYRSLVGDGPTSVPMDLSDEFHSTIVHRYIFELGYTVARRVITDPEFLILLDGIIEQAVDEDGNLCHEKLTLGVEHISGYTPGNTQPQGEVKVPDDYIDGVKDSAFSEQGLGVPLEIRRIFAHELGHWIVAKILGIEVGGVNLRWVKRPSQLSPDGYCTVFLGSACITLGFEQYLERRIAVLVAGSLAECGLKFPGKRGIGNELYQTLHSGHGSDDFEKATELIIIHAARRLVGTHRQMPVDREIGSAHVLETVYSILDRLGILHVILSDQYRSFVDDVIKQLRRDRAANWMGDHDVQLEISAEEITVILASDQAITTLIDEAIMMKNDQYQKQIG